MTIGSKHTLKTQIIRVLLGALNVNIATTHVFSLVLIFKIAKTHIKRVFLGVHSANIGRTLVFSFVLMLRIANTHTHT